MFIIAHADICRGPDETLVKLCSIVSGLTSLCMLAVVNRVLQSILFQWASLLCFLLLGVLFGRHAASTCLYLDTGIRLQATRRSKRRAVADFTM